MDKDLEQQIRNAYIEAMNKGTLPKAVRTFDDFLDYIDMLNDMDIDRESSARGGRIGLRQGTPEEGIGSLDAGASNITYEGNEGPKSPAEEMKMAGMMSDIAADFEIEHGYDMAVANPEMREAFIREWLKNNFYNKTDIPFNKGGRVGYALGTGPQGLPGIPRMAPDGMEYDMRMNGGFQGLGAKEGKDDVPAMLAKNEFVFTADAVRGAGGGDIELGAQKMYDTMKNLERRVT